MKTQEEWIKEIKEFVENKRRLPKQSIPSEGFLYQWMLKHRPVKEVEEIWNSFKHLKKPGERIQELKEFTEKNGRLPSQNIPSEEPLYRWAQKHHSSIKEVEEIWNSFSHPKTTEEWIKELKEFTEKNERYPNSHIPSEKYLYQWIRQHESIKEVQKICNKFKRYKTTKEWIKELKEFTEKNGRLPKWSIPSEKSLYMRVQQHKSSIKEVEDIWNSFSHPKTTEEWIKELRKFVERNKRLPRWSIPSEVSLYHWMQKNKSIKEVEEIWDSFRNRKTRKERLPEFIEWVMENKKFPSQHSNNTLEKFLYIWMSNNKEWTELKQFKILFKNRENSKAKELLEVFIKEI